LKDLITQRKYIQDLLEPTQLEPASMERYARDMDRHADAIVALKKTEAEFCFLIRSSFSHEAQILLRSDPRYAAASNSISSYDLYFVCRELQFQQLQCRTGHHGLDLL